MRLYKVLWNDFETIISFERFFRSTPAYDKDFLLLLYNMMKALEIFALCGMLALQQCVADSDVSMDEETQFIPKVTPEEFEIIDSCTQIPTIASQMIRYYFNSSYGQNNKQILKLVEEDVKTIDKEFQEMNDNVDKYTNEFEKIDPDVQFIQNRIKSNNENLQELINKMYQNIKRAASEAGDTENIEDRIAFVENKLQPTLLEFESICLVEMDDILANVLGKTK